MLAVVFAWLLGQRDSGNFSDKNGYYVDPKKPDGNSKEIQRVISGFCRPTNMEIYLTHISESANKWAFDLIDGIWVNLSLCWFTAFFFHTCEH